MDKFRCHIYYHIPKVVDISCNFVSFHKLYLANYFHLNHGYPTANMIR